MHSIVSLVYRELTSLVIIVTDINFKSSVCRDVEGGRSAACFERECFMEFCCRHGVWVDEASGYQV